MASVSSEPEVGLPDTVTASRDTGSSIMSGLTQPIGGRPRMDYIWHHITRDLMPDGKYKQVCKYCAQPCAPTSCDVDPVS
mgnify:CR=1 FL=1